MPADWDSYTLLLQRCRALQLKASGAGDTLHLCTENYFVTSSSKRVKEGQWGEAAMYQATNPKNTQHLHLPFSCWNKKINKLGGWIQSFFQLKMENTKSTWNSATETDSCTQGKRKGQWRSHEATSPSTNHPTLLDWRGRTRPLPWSLPPVLLLLRALLPADAWLCAPVPAPTRRGNLSPSSWTHRHIRVATQWDGPEGVQPRGPGLPLTEATADRKSVV